MTWVFRKYAFQAMARKIDPSIRLYVKRGRFWRAYAWIPFLLSLGTSSRRAFLEDTASVIGPLHFYPGGWQDIEHALHHEGRHTRQQRWFGLGIHPWLGLPLYGIAVGLLLPVGLTLRFWLELDAEAYALQRKFRTGSAPVFIRDEMLTFAEQLSGPGYLWSWPRQWARRIAGRRVSKIVRG